MAGRDSKPKNYGRAGHPAQVGQYRESFPAGLTDDREQDQKPKAKTRFPM